jgi:hypothetical protein
MTVRVGVLVEADERGDAGYIAKHPGVFGDDLT